MSESDLKSPYEPLARRSTLRSMKTKKITSSVSELSKEFNLRNINS